MVTHVLEGTWEEISKQANRLVGKQLSVTILDDEPERHPNIRALNTIQRVIDRQKDMRETDGESGVDIIRRGRAGEMFAMDRDQRMIFGWG